MLHAQAQSWSVTDLAKDDMQTAMNKLGIKERLPSEVLVKFLNAKRTPGAGAVLKQNDFASMINQSCLLQDIYKATKGSSSSAFSFLMNEQERAHQRSRDAYHGREAANACLQAQCRKLMRVDEPDASCKLRTPVIAKMLGIKQ